MTRHSLLVPMICTLVIACAITESIPGSKNGGGAAAASSAIPEGSAAALVTDTQNGGVKFPNSGRASVSAVVEEVVEEVVESFNAGGYGEEPVKMSGSSGGGAGGTGAAKVDANNVAPRTGQGIGSSVGK